MSNRRLAQSVAAIEREQGGAGLLTAQQGAGRVAFR